LEDPACIAFDVQRRLYVSEFHGYNLGGYWDVLIDYIREIFGLELAAKTTEE